MTQQHRYTKSFSHGDHTVIECEDCGFKHLWPLPTIDDLRETYERRFGGSVRPQFTERKKEDADYWRRVFERKLLTYKRLLPNVARPNVERPRILDIGCGVGDFLAYCKEQGFDVLGVEPSSHFHPTLEERNVGYIPSLIEDITSEQWKQEGPFDIVNMSMFLEHVLDPIEVVKAATSELVDGGILSIETPNDFNPLQKAAVSATGNDAWWINPLHINYFDFESLESLCKKMGFTPKHRTSQFPLEILLLMGDNYVGDDQLGREMHKKRVRFEKAMHDNDQAETLSDMYDALAQAGIGRQATIFALK